MDNPRCSNPKGPDTTGCFSFGDRLGLTFVAQMAAISALLVIGLLIVILVKGIRNSRRNHGQWPPHIFMYLVLLLAADLIQAIGALIDIKWIGLAGVKEGTFCTTQGVLKQVGDVGVALASLAIAVQTWSIVAVRWSSPKSPARAFVVIGVILGFIAVLNGIGLIKHHSKTGPLYGNTVLWCSNQNNKLLILLEYLWLWISAGISIVLYVHVAIVLYREQVPESRSGLEREEEDKTGAAETRQLALQMLFYPVIYVITVAPQSVVRLITLIHEKHYEFPNAPFPIAWQTFTAVVFGSSGALNVFLYTYTRPSLMASGDDGPVLDDKGDTSAELDAQTTSFEMNPKRASTLHYAYDNPYRPVSAHVAEQGLGGLPD